MHKDLSGNYRRIIELFARDEAQVLHKDGQSLAIAREAWINAFDAAAEELDGGGDD